MQKVSKTHYIINKLKSVMKLVKIGLKLQITF